MSLPHIKRETDGGRKSGYYAAILSGKNDHSLWSAKYSGAVCELLSHQHRNDFTYYTGKKNDFYISTQNAQGLNRI